MYFVIVVNVINNCKALVRKGAFRVSHSLMFIPGFKVLLHITHTNGQLDNLFGHHVSETAHQQ